MRGRAQMTVADRVCDVDYIADEILDDGRARWAVEILAVYRDGRNITWAPRVQDAIDGLEERLAANLEFYGRAT